MSNDTESSSNDARSKGAIVDGNGGCFASMTPESDLAQEPFQQSAASNEALEATVSLPSIHLKIRDVSTSRIEQPVILPQRVADDSNATIETTPIDRTMGNGIARPTTYPSSASTILELPSIATAQIALAVEDPFALSGEKTAADGASTGDLLELSNDIAAGPFSEESHAQIGNEGRTNASETAGNVTTVALPTSIGPSIGAISVSQDDYSQRVSKDTLAIRVDPEARKSPHVQTVDTSEETVMSSTSSRRIAIAQERATSAESSPTPLNDAIGNDGNLPLSWPRLGHDGRNSTLLSINVTAASDGDAQSGTPSSDLPTERPVDLHSITDTIHAASACIADVPTWTDQGIKRQDTANSPNRALSNDAPKSMAPRRKRPRPGEGNYPHRLHSFIKERYVAAPLMLFHLADEPPDDATREVFDRQLVSIPWNSPGQQAMSETPSVSTVLRFCYALSAWLNSDSNGVTSMSSVRSRHSNSPIAIVCCANGKTRTAVAISCYLKFSGVVDNVESGFCHFLERRCSHLNADPRLDAIPSPEEVVAGLPASLRTFFHNFDNAIELGEYMNRKPLLLKAIAVQGVPVEDRPCLDVWDASGHHVYSSDPQLWDDLKETIMDTHSPWKADKHLRRSTSQWADEEGFFRVNCLLQGDFCILCRFGGAYARGATDSTKILFRYANNTAFMGAASPYELSCSQVDLQRRYMHYFDDDDFMLSLMFDAHWTATNEAEKALLRRDCSSSILPDILTGAGAMESGWHEIVRHHIVRPTESDVDELFADSLGELEGCPRHIVSLALQLANFDSTMAQTILLEGRLRSWWQTQLDDSSSGDLANEDFYSSATTILDDTKQLSQAESLTEIRNLLETFDSVGKADLLLEQLQSLAKRRLSHAMHHAAQRSEASRSLSTSYISPIMRPNPGDVVSAVKSSLVSTLFRAPSSTFMDELPRLPVLPHRRKRGIPDPTEDLKNDAALDLLLRLNHPGVNLNDLLDVSTILRELDKDVETQKRSEHLPSHRIDSPDHAVDTIISSATSENDQKQAGSGASAVAALIAARSSAGLSNVIKDQPNHLTSQTKSLSAVAALLEKRASAFDGTLPNDTRSEVSATTDHRPDAAKLSEDNGAAAAVAAAMAKREKPVPPVNTEVGEPPSSGVPIKDDPVFHKYFKMRKMGLPDGGIRNAMKRDGVNTIVLDLDPERSFMSQTQPSNSMDDNEEPQGPNAIRLLRRG
jgi:hypothetical protein